MIAVYLQSQPREGRVAQLLICEFYYDVDSYNRGLVYHTFEMRQQSSVYLVISVLSIVADILLLAFVIPKICADTQVLYSLD